jgi:hypothetical protein
MTNHCSARCAEQWLVIDRHIEDALKELLFEGGELTKQLLGAGRAS